MPTKHEDPFDLARFAEAQADTYATALAEIRRGRKQGHWMWFIFPQLYRYGIRSLGEASAYLAHPLLGPRYRECVGALQDLDRADPVAVFNSFDARNCSHH